MLSNLSIDTIYLADKRNKQLLSKLIKAAQAKATDKEMIEIIRKHKSNESKLPFDMARILAALNKTMDELVNTMKFIAHDIDMINTIGSIMSEEVKAAVDDKPSIEDEKTKITWKTSRKLLVVDKTKQPVRKPRVKPTTKGKK